MPKASTRALGADPKDRHRKDYRAESSDVTRIRAEVERDARAAARAGGAATVSHRVDALTAIVPPPTPTTPDGFAVRDHLAIAGLIESRRRIASALDLGCEEHDADPGTWCWGSRLSAPRGLCTARYLRGLRAPAAVAR